MWAMSPHFASILAIRKRDGSPIPIHLSASLRIAVPLFITGIVMTTGIRLQKDKMPNIGAKQSFTYQTKTSLSTPSQTPNDTFANRIPYWLSCFELFERKHAQLRATLTGNQ
jgi:hypothetical protein